MGGESNTRNISNYSRQKSSQKHIKKQQEEKKYSLQLEKILRVYFRWILKDENTATSLRLWEGHFNRVNKGRVITDGLQALEYL